MTSDLKRINILGYGIDKITMQELLNAIYGFVKDGTPHSIILLNPYLILEAEKYPEYSAYIRDCDIVTPDGHGLLLAAKLMGESFPERVTGSDLMPRLAELCVKNGFKLYFVGGKPGVAETAGKVYKSRFPGLQVLGTRDGYFTINEEAGIIEDIKKKKPDVLMVCLGAYKQEMFIVRHMAEMQVPVVFGNGAALDFMSGRVARAPKWVQDIGMEWFFRLMHEPKRLYKRYLVGNAVFAWKVLSSLINNKREAV